jgi:predicted metal-dependent hydrolase
MSITSQFDLFIPEYTVRKSPRAKYLRLRITQDAELEVVVPKRMSLKHVQPFVLQNTDWIEKHKARQRKKNQHREALPEGKHLPEMINLRALDETWHVSFRENTSSLYRIRQFDRHIIQISGPANDKKNAQNRLHRWLKQRAKECLPVLLEQVSDAINLPFKKCVIRSQRTRWGSCSSHGTISLNYKLIFLPPELVEYLFIHELCHTIHMNHSRHYWAEVEQYCPDYRLRDKELTNASRYIPLWVSA